MCIGLGLKNEWREVFRDMSNEDRNSDAFDLDASFYFICSFVCLFSGAIRFAIIE